MENTFFYFKGEKIRRRTSRKLPVKEHIVNEDIRFSRVFVINQKGEKLGVLNTRQAILAAKAEGLNLVIISSNTNPPVAKIMDYGKFKYNRKKRQKEEKTKQTVINNREVRLTPLIGEHDLMTKVRKGREFILNGDRLKVSLKFKGRELARKDLGYETLNRFFEHVSDIAKIDKTPTLNAHRFLDMYLTQDKKKIKLLKGENNAQTKDKIITNKEN